MKSSASEIERNQQWHTKCIRKFFGVKELPELEVTREDLEQLALSTVHKGMTVPGVQKKISLHLSQENDKKRLTIVDYPTGYILKPQTEDFQLLPEYEFAAMQMAEMAGIKVVPYALLNTPDGKAYITKRMDRSISDTKICLFAMEDFCQLSGRMTQDKYRSSYEQCARVIKKYSERVKLDLTELFLRVVFSFLIGNSDMHLKNLSLIEEDAGSRRFSLSAAYDLLPVNVVMPEDTEELAMPVNGKKQNLRKKDFLLFAEKCEIEKKIAERMIRKLCSFESKFIDMIEDSFLDEKSKEAFIALLQKRIKVFV